jgi:Zn-dependent protease
LKCDFCGKDEALPFVCNYCGGAFCPEHRLPEAHMCKGDLTQKRTMVSPPQTTFSWQTPATTPTYGPPKQATVFSRIEIRDIAIAWLALGVAFTFALSRFILGGGFSVTDFGADFVLALLTVGPGFVLHELSHKFVAQRYGFWAEFRMWPMGLVLALVTSLIGFIFAAPGATYISGQNISKEENGRISIAGPLVNIVIGVLFLPLALFASNGSFFETLGVYGSYINIFLALFNLLPIGPLDGAKVWHWNVGIWAAIFIPTGLAFFYLFFA